MELNVSVLPEILELTSINQSVSLVYSSSDPTAIESNGVIDSFTSDTPDLGVTLSVSSESVSLTGSGYSGIFKSEIAYAKPQVDLLTKPEYIESNSWVNVPDPEDTEDIWFLYKYKPPENMTKTVTYTVSGTYTETSDLGMEETGIPFSLTFTQVVTYDSDTNVAEFKRYV